MVGTGANYQGTGKSVYTGATMRRLFILILLIAGLLSVSCGESPQVVPNSPQNIDQVVLSIGASGSNVTSQYNDSNHTETISENLGGNMFDNDNATTILIVKKDCFYFQKAVYTSTLTVQVSDVKVQINADLVDKYGNKSNGLIATCELSSATAKNFNWDNLDQAQAWGDYDSTWLLPSLTQ
jgi:hypothetical protein